MMTPGPFSPEFMADLKLRSKRRRKEQFRRLNTTFLFLGLLIAGILVCFVVLGVPYILYLMGMENTQAVDNFSETPAVSMNPFLRSVGIGASEDLKIINPKLQHFGAQSWVVGNVMNVGNQSYTGVTIYFDLFDAEGEPVGTTYILIGDIGPGDIKAFTTNQARVMASSAKVKYILNT